MKNLKLTILKQQGFVGELMNVFGQPKHIRPMYGNNRFIQFDFPTINLFTLNKIEPVYRLINSFEEQNGLLNTKVLHLFDDKNKSYSHVSYLCMRGVWIRQEYSKEIATSTNLLELL